MKPMIEARPIAGAESRTSFMRGIRSLNFGVIALMVSVCSRLSKISEMPNRPMASAVNDNPPVSVVLPKVRRATPSRWSRPIAVSRRPSTTMIVVLSREPADTTAMTLNARSSSTTWTDGPIAIMTLASGGVISIRPTIENVPPTKLPTAETISAGPARPRRAIS